MTDGMPLSIKEGELSLNASVGMTASDMKERELVKIKELHDQKDALLDGAKQRGVLYRLGLDVDRIQDSLFSKACSFNDRNLRTQLNGLSGTAFKDFSKKFASGNDIIKNLMKLLEKVEHPDDTTLPLVSEELCRITTVLKADNVEIKKSLIDYSQALLGCIPPEQYEIERNGILKILKEVGPIEPEKPGKRSWLRSIFHRTSGPNS